MSQLMPCSYCNGPGDCFVCGGSGWVAPPVKVTAHDEREKHLAEVAEKLINTMQGELTKAYYYYSPKIVEDIIKSGDNAAFAQMLDRKLPEWKGAKFHVI